MRSKAASETSVTQRHSSRTSPSGVVSSTQVISSRRSSSNSTFRLSSPFPLDNYELLDRYRRESGRVFLTGTQALVRIPLMQRTLDRAAGLNTAGFVSGYRGSPLGAVDQELWRAKAFLDESNIEFLPAVNEDLAATAVLGSQQVETDPHRTVDGVFSIWYGKGPGVDRAGDALKHGNAYGSSPNGGVLVVAGDDHGCVSSSMPHQSDVAFLTFMMPWLNPANVAEFLEFGLYGIALSRYSGMWVGFKAISETVESAMSVELPPYPEFVIPDFEIPAGGLHYRWPDLPGPQIEERLEAKKAATLAFAGANPIDHKVFDIPKARYGIVTTGKGHLDLMEALRMLGIDRAEARRIGLDVYKVGMVWPLEPQGALDFVQGKREVLVVEEKRGIIESQLKEYFYDHPGRKPERMVGKQDENGDRLVPWIGELAPVQLAQIVARRLDAEFTGLNLTERADKLLRGDSNLIRIEGANRMPYFCSGCPHNTSTKVPEGSSALAGIGCHFMASWMDRETEGLLQMGGEGVNWITRSKFNGNRHIFQNLGDGTYFHSVAPRTFDGEEQPWAAGYVQAPGEALVPIHTSSAREEIDANGFPTKGRIEVGSGQTEPLRVEGQQLHRRPAHAVLVHPVAEDAQGPVGRLVDAGAELRPRRLEAHPPGDEVVEAAGPAPVGGNAVGPHRIHEGRVPHARTGRGARRSGRSPAAAP